MDSSGSENIINNIKHPIPQFQKPAVYEIVVNGKLDKKWASRMGGMSIEYFPQIGGHEITTLTGNISDQSALAGILNTLYENHFVIVSVNIKGVTDSE